MINTKISKKRYSKTKQTTTATKTPLTYRGTGLKTTEDFLSLIMQEKRQWSEYLKS